ncbi:MAG: hypothetical protein OXI16_03020 [Chloroflexota bacterium]|nr:hypothetical protein [Chloroflexota bacterium]
METEHILAPRPTFEHALQAAESASAAQLSKLGGGDVVVFLQRMHHNPDYVLDVSRKADEANWRQHNVQTGLFSADGDVGASATFNTASGSAQGDEQNEEFSIDELRERIKAMDNLLKEGEGIQGYKKCIEDSLLFENFRRENIHLSTTVADVATFLSGMPDDFVVHEFSTTYHKQWFTGDNASLFDYGDNQVTTTRPIPAGGYEVYRHFQKAEWVPCDYVAPPTTWRYTFESDEDVLHEAFFDPVDIDDAVGADGDSGVLQPDSFESEEGETVMERIAWQEGQVEMALSPATDLLDHRIDFIALDGSVALRLDFDDAVERVDEDVATLAWGVCVQPWSDGDLLMLRIAEGIPDDGVAAVNDEECLAALPEIIPAPEPTATTEPESTAQPMPEPTATPVP